jgi:hypothetical protein
MSICGRAFWCPSCAYFQEIYENIIIEVDRPLIWILVFNLRFGKSENAWLFPFEWDFYSQHTKLPNYK